MTPPSPSPPLDLTRVFEGKRVLFIGATGFVGKVALSMLLRRYPNLERLFVLVRPGAGSSAEDRFFRKVVASPTFDPIREVWGEGTAAFLREKCVPLPGDVSRPLLNFGPAELERLGRLDAIVNCAGVVSFTPPLDSALRINVYGAQNALEVAKRTGAALVHISTCFVAGERDGEIWEDEPAEGYFPRRGELRDQDFSAAAEVADCQRLIDQLKQRADDRAHVSMFRDLGAKRLRDEERDEDDPRALKLAVQRERKVWLATEQTKLGRERAKHWGWPNTYTYTKSLGDQIVLGQSEVRACLVRPAIVESAVRYPFPGWNEGFTTTAPLILLGLMGHRLYPAGQRTILDIIPVDLVAAGIIAATGAILDGSAARVYHLGSSDSNPLYMPRTIEVVGLYKRRYFQRRTEGVGWWNRLQSRLEVVPVEKERYERWSAPLWKSVADRAIRWIDEATPRWGAPRVQAAAEHARQRLQDVSDLTTKSMELFDLFMPFLYDREYIFRCDNTRQLFARLAPQDRVALRWDPEAIQWRDYFLETHIPGLEKWVFPEIEAEFQAKPRPVYTYKDLLELFDATTKHHRHRTAMRLMPKPEAGRPGKGDEAPARYTYQHLARLAAQGAQNLRDLGAAPSEKVLLLSENRPEWGITYFAILKAGGVVVPIDGAAVGEEIVNCVRAAGARFAVISDRQLERLVGEGFDPAAHGVRRLSFDDLLVRAPEAPATTALVHQPKSDDLASLIFTSGTTGRPKGVMLTHKNFTSLLAKLAGVFDFDRHDGLLSVLPLHHTFEFTAGLLMPLMRGAQIAYLDELNTESLEAAFAERTITGLVGVPALWQLLQRRILKPFAERGRLWERLFLWLLERNRKLRDQTPTFLDHTLGLNLGKLLFLPIHQRFGGRIRTMISGGSALPAETMNLFRGLGFALFEGYGLTEAAPVLAVQRPGKRLLAGSVGEPLPGIDVKIHDADVNGVGEVIAAGPNVMAGYWQDPAATAAVLHDGWLHTGDLGRFDDDGRLYIVGRKKDLILGKSGENVYPDELEDRYRDSPYLKELSVVGLPDGEGSEVPACLAVPEYDGHGELGREGVRERLREHFKDLSTKLPPHKRIKVLHLSDRELPKTATRKVKRPLVVEELRKLERVKLTAGGGLSGARSESWLHDVLAQLSGRPRERVFAEARLADLGFDSLMLTELGLALEGAGVAVPESADLSGVATVGDLERLVEGWGRSKRRREAPAARAAGDDEITIPKPLVAAGDAALTWAQKATYARLLKVQVRGRSYIPKTRNFLVAANHASHLDMGLVKHALGEWGEHLRALAAKDYFFEDPVKRAYFENFTNLVPMDRHGSLRESLRLASEVLAQGFILLIFPEGTRSLSGVMTEFKPSIGYLALANQADVLPMYLEGTYEAMPKGSFLPKRREIAAHIGPLLDYSTIRAAVAGLPRGEQNRAAAALVEQAVRRLAPSGSPDRTRGTFAGEEERP